jgi:pimeloyl-ACP methyl ester carboxylesterase
VQRPSILLIHGAATGAWIWEKWQRHLGALGWQAIVLDLRGHGLSMPVDLATVTLEDYVADIASVAPQIEAAQGQFPIIGGWDTGALLALMYAAGGAKPPALLLMSPVPPVEVAGRAPIEVVRSFAGDVLSPEAFGLGPRTAGTSGATGSSLSESEWASLREKADKEQESGIAYRQALRGVSIPPGAIERPALTLCGPEERERAKSLAAHLAGEAIEVPYAGRWSIVWHDQAVRDAATAVDAWLIEHLGDSQEG